MRAFAADVMAAAGCSAAEADIVAEVLVEADMRGVYSHGVMRLTPYTEWIREGRMRPGAEIREVASSPAMAVLDAGAAVGPLSAAVGVDRAVELAKAGATGFVFVAERHALRSGGALGAARGGARLHRVLRQQRWRRGGRAGLRQPGGGPHQRSQSPGRSPAGATSGARGRHGGGRGRDGQGASGAGRRHVDSSRLGRGRGRSARPPTPPRWQTSFRSPVPRASASGS